MNLKMKFASGTVVLGAAFTAQADINSYMFYADVWKNNISTDPVKQEKGVYGLKCHLAATFLTIEFTNEKGPLFERVSMNGNAQLEKYTTLPKYKSVIVPNAIKGWADLYRMSKNVPESHNKDMIALRNFVTECDKQLDAQPK